MTAPPLARAALVVGAGAAVLAGAPTQITAPLTGLAALAVGQRVLRLRSRGVLDAVLVGTGLLLVLLVLLGFALDLLGVPLARTGWTVALMVLGCATLALPVRAPDSPAAAPTDPAPVRDDGLRRLAPWVAASVALAAVAVLSAVRATEAVDISPVELSLGVVGEATAQVLVAADRPTGQLELRSATAGSTLSYPLFALTAGGSRATEIVVPERGRTVVTVSNPGQSVPLRTLVIDR